MKFANHLLEAEYRQHLHAEVTAALEQLDAWLIQAALPEVTVTHVLRTPAQQEDIYWRAVAHADGLSEPQARARARAKFSWHLCGCAADVRNREYTDTEIGRIMAQLGAGRVAPEWELLSHDVGRGGHIHIGRRDDARRALYAP